MNQLTHDLIVIDTNIFEHLRNLEKNTNAHITCLLSMEVSHEQNYSHIKRQSCRNGGGAY